jgi:hypothetical protein
MGDEEDNVIFLAYGLKNKTSSVLFFIGKKVTYSFHSKYISLFGP